MKRRRSSSGSSTLAEPHPLERLFALDELFLRVLSFLSPSDLARAQRVSRHWARMAVDPQLWKRLYLERYPHPHHSRLLPSRARSVGPSISGASTPLRPIARLPSRAFPPPSPSPSPAPSDDGNGRHEPHGRDVVNDEELTDTPGLVRHDGVDWKVMMRLGTNWANGNVLVESSIVVPPSPAASATASDTALETTRSAEGQSQQRLALFPSFICMSHPSSPLVHVYTASDAQPLSIVPPPPGWSSPSRPDNVTAICADQAVVPAEATREGGRIVPARLGIFYASGGFATVRLRLVDGRLEWAREAVTARPPRRRPAPDADHVVLAALHYPVLVTCTHSFHLSVYTLSLGATPTLLRTLHSDVSFHPAALALFPSSTGHFRAALTYSAPLYPSSWSVAVQELGIQLPLPTRSGAVRRGQSYRLGSEVDGSTWPRRVTPLVGVRGAVGVGSDGRWCVLAGDDSVIHVYALSTAREHSITHAQSLLAPRGVSSVALAAGRCVSGGSDGRVLVWELDDEGEQVEQGEARVGRAAGYVEVKPGGRRRPQKAPRTEPADAEGAEVDDLADTESQLPHPASVSAAARSLFLASPPASMRPAPRPEPRTGAGVRQLAFDEEKIVGLLGDGDTMRVWSFG